MQDEFARALGPVLTHEGGKVDNPRDPGGRTNQGIIQRVYDGYRKNKGLPRRDVFLMTNDERDEIYRKQYWDVVRGDDLPAGVSYVVFDGSVNSGPSQAAKWLQRALGTVKVDGVIGEATVAACAAHPNHDELVAAICERRILFLMQLKTWSTFGKGWARRVADVQRRGQLWASGAIEAAPPVAFIDGANAKAPIEAAAPRPSAMVGDAATGGGVATGGVAGVLQSAQDTLTPLAGTSAVIQKVVVALIILGALCAIGGVAYSKYQRYRQCKRADALDLPMPAEGAAA